MNMHIPVPDGTNAPAGGVVPADWDNEGGTPRCVVVGAGFGGIAAALRMRAKGYRVLVLDRAPMLGGRAQVFKRDGYTHDAGPTVITAPFLFDELFTLFGKQREDYVTFVPLKPWYRFRFWDGSTFDYGGTLEETLAEIRKHEPRDAEGYQRLLKHSEKLFDAGFTELADAPFNTVTMMLRQVPRLAKLQAYLSVSQFVAKYLKNPKIRQAFSIQPLLVGGNPFVTTSIYGLIHFLERKWGVYFTMGGTGALVAAFGRLMAEEGIEVRQNTTVGKIDVERRRARGVILEDGTRIAAEIVVSNADAMHLHRHMLPTGATNLQGWAKKRSRLSMGLYVLYFGTTKTYPDVAHHTIWFGPRFKEHLHDIFTRKHLSEDFSLYVHRPTATDKSFAPEGHESFYALCPVPNQDGKIDWAVEAPRLRERIIGELDRTMLPGLKDHIISVFEMTPDDFATRYLSVAGAGFSISPFFTQSAWFRFHNKAEGVDGLFLVGAGTHPGAGLPGVVSSAKVIDKLIPAATARR